MYFVIGSNIFSVYTDSVAPERVRGAGFEWLWETTMLLTQLSTILYDPVPPVS